MDAETRAIREMKKKQANYYDRGSKPLSVLQSNDGVRMKLPGEDTWITGVCEGSAGPWSYDVRVGETTYRRNRRMIMKTNEDPQLELPDREVEKCSQPKDTVQQMPKRNAEDTPPRKVAPPPPGAPHQWKSQLSEDRTECGDKLIFTAILKQCVLFFCCWLCILSGFVIV